ncbi:MAG: M48 family metallopeptidase [Pseudomonadota bacterium]
MATLLKLLPLIVIAFFIWRAMTAKSRTTASLMRNSKPLNDWQILEAVRIFADRLGVPGFQVRILDMEQVNGVALPGGEIFISRGLYEKFLGNEVSRDEIAAVIAHEIGHVALGHHKRRIWAWRKETAAIVLLGVLLSRIIFSWIGLLALLGLNIYRNQMTQRDEFEADAFSVQLMMRSDLNPKSVISLLSKLENWVGGSVDRSNPISWLISHPPLPERIERAKEVIAAGIPQSDFPKNEHA